jgi:hypothetical protein
MALAIWLTLMTWSLSAQERSVPFGTGEQMEYKIHYGFVNAAEAVMRVKPQLEKVDEEDCYQIEIVGKTIGMFDLFMRVRDKFGTYIDEDLLVPRKFYRQIEEGKYRKHEIVDFDIDNDLATVKKYDSKKEVWKKSVEYDTYEDAQDLVSGYYYLRTLDFNNYAEGDTISVNVFFDDENSKFQMIFLGKESVKTKIGRYDALVISPLMPKNKLFDGKDAIKVWLSDDQDKIPLKVKAQMFIGALEIDIKKYKRGVK